MTTGRTLVLLTFGVLLSLPATAGAQVPGSPDRWLPNTDGAVWTYQWTDSAYAQTPTTETYALQDRSAAGFRLGWTTDGQNNQPGSVESRGTVDFRYEDVGLVNTTWNSTPPPGQFPILCPSVTNCGNAMHSTAFMLIWGTRSPVLREPLVRGTQWSTSGGQEGDVASVNRYVGRESITVPAFPLGVTAAKVVSDVTQAGALGDPYGSGTRTVWWAYGVGPVKVEFLHTGGARQVAELTSTNLVPRQAPSEESFLPLQRGRRQVFRMRNTRHLRRWSKQRVTVDQVQNGTAKVDVKDLAGPLKVAASYLLSSRLTGVTNLQGSVRAATRLRLPRVGPRSAPIARRPKLLTPVDFLSYGFNPIVQAFPKRGEKWTSNRRSRDFSVYGVTGTTRVIGPKRVRVPKGRFKVIELRSTLRQRGFEYGSGVRRTYLASGVGLIKLEFRHRDGSVTTIERVR